MAEERDTSQPLAKLLGVEIVEATKAKIVGKLLVRPDICTTWDTLHGGAIMAFDDTLGDVVRRGLRSANRAQERRDNFGWRFSLNAATPSR